MNKYNISGKSGLIREYLIAFGSLENYISRIENNEDPRTRFLAKRTFQRSKFKKYLEYFDSQNPEDLINENNKCAVKRLDELVDILNGLKEKDNENFEILATIRNEIKEIIS